MYRILSSNLTLAGLLALAAVLAFLASLPVVGVVTGGLALAAIFRADEEGILHMTAGDCAELDEYEDELRARRHASPEGYSSGDGDTPCVVCGRAASEHLCPPPEGVSLKAHSILGTTPRGEES